MRRARASAILGLLLGLYGPSSLADAPASVRYAGGDGSSVAKAVVILGATEESGVLAEYRWLDARFPGWKGGDQSLLNQDKKVYDVMNFTLPDGSRHSIFFDITDYFGKY